MAAPSPSAERGLIELWHHGATRCLMTPPDREAPFLVNLHEADILVAEQAFDDHNAACVAAVDALRRAVGRR